MEQADVARTVVLPRLEGIRASGDGWTARCPAHDDTSPSLSISVGSTTPVVLHCHAGCDTDTVLAALSLSLTDIQAEPVRQSRGEWTPAGEASHVYSYRDENGELLYQVLRVPTDGGKTFRQRVPDADAKSGWTWRLGDVRRVPYRLPDVIGGIGQGLSVWITEGEKDADMLAADGLVATTAAGGAGSWREDYNQHFHDADVNIIADRDEPGRKHARDVAARLDGVAATVRILEPIDGKDLSDHVTAGHTADQLVTTFDSDRPEPVELAPDLHEFLGVDDPPRDWVIPGLLEHGDRMLWTGHEGLGKSMVTRQLAVAAASGLHPFWNNHFEPQRVLYIDLENSERLSRRKFRPMDRVSRRRNHPVPQGQMRLIHHPQGVDLTEAHDAAWLLERVTAHQPDLLVIGPWYRLHAALTEEERFARQVVRVLDHARTRVNCALVTEAHAGHGDSLSRKIRPAGSSLMLRWPELGLGMSPDRESDDPGRSVVLTEWRGARDERDWPSRLTWGTVAGHWPWVDPDTSPSWYYPPE